jgi:hypothetical protein
MPRARCKCPACKGVILLKHRNLDRQLVIVNDEDEARLLEEGLYKDTIRAIGAESAHLYDQTFSRLELKSRRHPSHFEVLCGTLVLLERASREAGNHGVACSYRYLLSEAYARAGKEEDALRLVCQCCYLDICGPENNVQQGESPFFPWVRDGRKWQRTVRSIFGESRESFRDFSPFPDGLLADLDEYRKSLKVNSQELQRCAAVEARCMASYTQGCVDPDLFAADLIRELGAYLRRSR